MGSSGVSSGAPGAGRIGPRTGRLWLRWASALDRSMLRGLGRTGGEIRTDTEIRTDAETIIIDKMTTIMTTDTNLRKTLSMTCWAGVSPYRVSTSSKEVLKLKLEYYISLQYIILYCIILSNFFFTDMYYRVNLQTKRVDYANPPYPRPIGKYWLGCKDMPGAEKRWVQL